MDREMPESPATGETRRVRLDTVVIRGCVTTKTQRKVVHSTSKNAFQCEFFSMDAMADILVGADAELATGVCSLSSSLYSVPLKCV